jgi:hypothetical protein
MCKNWYTNLYRYGTMFSWFYNQVYYTITQNMGHFKIQFVWKYHSIIYMLEINLFVEDFRHPSSLSVCVIHFRKTMLCLIFYIKCGYLYSIFQTNHTILFSIQYGMSHQTKLWLYTVPTVIWSVQQLRDLGESKTPNTSEGGNGSLTFLFHNVTLDYWTTWHPIDM